MNWKEFGDDVLQIRCVERFAVRPRHNDGLTGGRVMNLPNKHVTTNHTPTLARWTNLKSRQSDARLKGRRILRLLDHCSFLFLVRLIVVEPRSKFDVEDIRFREPMGQILQNYRMYCGYK